MQKPARFFGLDIHKYFMVAVAVDAEKKIVYGPRRVEWPQFEHWIENEIKASDAVVIVTPHTAIDYKLVVNHAQLVIDSANATRKMDGTGRVVRLGAPDNGNHGKIGRNSVERGRGHGKASSA